MKADTGPTKRDTMLIGVVRQVSKVISIRWLLGATSLPVAVAAQCMLDARLTAWPLFALATIGFLLGFNHSPRLPSAPTHCGIPLRSSAKGGLLTICGAAASLGSYAFFGGNRLTWAGVLLWQMGLGLLIVGAAAPDLRPAIAHWRQRCRAASLRPSVDLVLLMLLVGAGAVFRLWRIADLPAEPGVDLPLVFLSVEKILHGEWPIFSTYHPGREGLYLYLAAGYVRLFGLSYPALRTLGALIGIATIPLVYSVGRRMFGKEVGLMAAGFLAVNRWHIILSRTGLRFILMPFFALLLVAALDRALENRKPSHWAVVGLVLGWGFHTYSAWLVMPAVVVGALVLRRLADRDWQRDDLRLLLLAAAVAAIVFIPLARFAHDDPQMYTLRVASRLAGREVPLPANLAQTAWKNVLRTAGMFNLTGDGVAHINVPLKRQLGMVSGAFFVVGTLYLLVAWRRHPLLLVALIGTCVPTTLAFAFPWEVPNAGRASGAVGLACLAAAVPLSSWRRQLGARFRERARAAPCRHLIQAVLLLGVVSAIGAEGWETRDDYFVRYSSALAGANYPVSTRLVDTIVQFSSGGQVFLIAYPHFYDGNAVRTQLRLAGSTWENELLEVPIESPPWSDGDLPVMVILHPGDGESLRRLLDLLPQAAVFVHPDNLGEPAFLTLVAEP